MHINQAMRVTNFTPISVSFLDYCGKTIELTETDSKGTVSMKVSADQLKDCTLMIAEPNENKTLQTRFIVGLVTWYILELHNAMRSSKATLHFLQGIDFPSCNDAQLTVSDQADDPSLKYQVFSSYPHFCGSPVWAEDDSQMAVWFVLNSFLALQCI